MINELVQQLKQLKPGKGQFVVGDTTIDYNITDNGYSIKMVSGTTDKKECSEIEKAAEEQAASIKKIINDHVDKFKEDMDKIDDDIFQSACELFSKNAPFSLNDLSKAFDRAIDFKLVKSGTDMFRRAVNLIIENKIDRLKKQIQNI